VEEVNKAFKDAAEGELKGILGYSEEELVSTDYKGCSNSSTVDAAYTMVAGNLLKVLSWYDNEWGYSVRVARPRPLHGHEREPRHGLTRQLKRHTSHRDGPSASVAYLMTQGGQ